MTTTQSACPSRRMLCAMVPLSCAASPVSTARASGSARSDATRRAGIRRSSPHQRGRHRRRREVLGHRQAGIDAGLHATTGFSTAGAPWRIRSSATRLASSFAQRLRCRRSGDRRSRSVSTSAASGPSWSHSSNGFMRPSRSRPSRQRPARRMASSMVARSIVMVSATTWRSACGFVLRAHDALAGGGAVAGDGGFDEVVGHLLTPSVW
jgi:hypothetical protein